MGDRQDKAERRMGMSRAILLGMVAIMLLSGMALADEDALILKVDRPVRSE